MYFVGVDCDSQYRSQDAGLWAGVSEHVSLHCAREILYSLAMGDMMISCRAPDGII